MIVLARDCHKQQYFSQGLNDHLKFFAYYEKYRIDLIHIWWSDLALRSGLVNSDKNRNPDQVIYILVLSGTLTSSILILKMYNTWPVVYKILNPSRFGRHCAYWSELRE